MASRARVLIVEDNPADAAVYSRYLRDLDGRYDIAVAETAEDGLKRAVTLLPDIILLDYDLPDQSGLEFLEELSAAVDESERAVVVAVTGQRDPRVAAGLIRAGAVDYLSKADASEHAVRSAVAHALEMRTLRLDLVRHEREQEASRRALVASLERASFLASLSEALMHTLDVNDVVAQVARLAVPAIADAAFVDVLEGGTLTRRATALGGVFQDRPDLVLEKNAPGLEAAEGAAKVVRSSAAASYGRTWLPAIARWDRDIDRLMREGLERVIVIPLVFDGHPLGAITFASVNDRGEHAQEVAEEVGRRASGALANARAFEAERLAKRASESARRRLNVVSRVSAAFSRSLDWRITSTALVDLLVPSFCDHATVLVEESEGVRPVATRSADDRMEQAMRRLGGFLSATADAPAGPGLALRTGQSEFYPDATELASRMRAQPKLPEMTALRNVGSYAAVPIVAPNGRPTGAIVLATKTERTFGFIDLAVAEDLGRRAGMALENARLFERERAIARTLQTTLLPAEIPEIPGVSIAARCIAGGEGVEVGGDWYDVIALPGGRVAFAVGDVAGRGVIAAATMGQLRSSLRAYVLEGCEPGAALSRLNTFVLSQDRADFATVLLGVLDVGQGLIRLASAGHLPPLLIDADGRASTIDVPSSLPVGLIAGTTYEQTQYYLSPGAVLSLYTDGLVESRSRGLEEGITDLVDLAAEGDTSPEELVGRALRRVGSNAGDDVTILAFRFAGLAASDEEADGARSIRMSLPAVPSSAPQVRRRLETFLHEAGLGSARMFDLQLAVGEAVANAVEHAYGGGEERETFTVRATRRGDGICVEVADTGLWRDNVPRRDDSISERGRGVGLMRALCDDVEIERSVAGTRIRLWITLRAEEVSA